MDLPTHWTQAGLDDYLYRIGQPTYDLPPPLRIEDIEAEIEEMRTVPQWRREMDPRDRAWLDRVDSWLSITG